MGIIISPVLLKVAISKKDQHSQDSYSRCPVNADTFPLCRYPGKPGAVVTGESEKARERLHRPPSTEVQHPEAEAPIWDNNVFFSMLSTERRGENSCGCLSVCSILQWAFCWRRGWALWKLEEGPQALS